ncbi:MAG: hypothetical protein V2B13_13715 [Pseudomonadota bacterium]
MQPINKEEIKELMKEAFIGVLSERKDILEEAVSEAILDLKFGVAIEEGDTGEYVSEERIIEKLAK